MLRAVFLVPPFAFVAFASTAAPAAPDSGLNGFLAGFADLAARGAADSLAKLTRFPLRNRVHQEPERIGAADFRRYFARNGMRELAACLKSTPPQRAGGGNSDLGQWQVDCDGNVFYFAKEGGGWRFTGFENVNE